MSQLFNISRGASTSCWISFVTQRTQEEVNVLVEAFVKKKKK